MSRQTKCFVAVFCVLFAGCAKYNQPTIGKYTIEQGVLTVGVEVGYPPMEYFDTDGKTPTGFDIDLTKALADKLGLEVKYIDTAWEGILAGVQTGKYDLAVNVTVLPERQKAMNFTKPYIDNSMAIVLHKDSVINQSITVQRPEDISGYRVAYQADTTAQYFTEKLSERGAIFSPFSYDKILYCFNDLELHRVDFVVVDSLVAFDYAGKENSRFIIGWQGIADEVIGFCLKKGNDALTIALNNAMDELFNEGVMLEISLKYFNCDMISSVRAEYW